MGRQTQSYPPPSDPPRDSLAEVPDEPNAPLGVRVARVITAGTLAAGAAAVPALLRIAASKDLGAHPLQVEAALTTLVLLPMMGLIVLLRMARAGLRAFEGEGANVRVIGFGFFCAFLFAGSAHAGMLLRATTHHRPLAGVTFAAAILVLLIVSACIVVRAVDFMKTYPRSRWVFVALTAIILAFTVARFARSHVGMLLLTAATRTVIVDVLGFVIAAIFAARTILFFPRVVAFVGIVLFGTVIVVGCATMRHDAQFKNVMRDRAATYYPLLTRTLPW